MRLILGSRFRVDPRATRLNQLSRRHVRAFAHFDGCRHVPLGDNFRAAVVRIGSAVHAC